MEASLGENYRAGGAGASSSQSLLPMDILQAAIGAEYEAFTQNKVGGIRSAVLVLWIRTFFSAILRVFIKIMLIRIQL